MILQVSTLASLLVEIFEDKIGSQVLHATYPSPCMSNMLLPLFEFPLASLIDLIIDQSIEIINIAY